SLAKRGVSSNSVGSRLLFGVVGTQRTCQKRSFWHCYWRWPPGLRRILRQRTTQRRGMMLLDPTRLKTLRQFADEAPVFTVNYLRWLLNHTAENGFASCVVRCA